MKKYSFECGFICGIIMLAACIALSGCVTPPVAHPSEPSGGIIVAPDHQAFLITDFRHELLLKNNIPSSWFTASGDKNYPWRMDSPHENAAYDILQKQRN